MAGFRAKGQWQSNLTATQGHQVLPWGSGSVHSKSEGTQSYNECEVTQNLRGLPMAGCPLLDPPAAWGPNSPIPAPVETPGEPL